MMAVITLSLIIFLQLLANRVGAIVLVFTGLSEDVAKFQARSALFGCGFTTVESEEVMSNPVRRKIIYKLMFLGHVGIIATISGTILGVVKLGNSEESVIYHCSLFFGSLIVVGLLARSALFERLLYKGFRLISKRFNLFSSYRMAHIATLPHNHTVMEYAVKPRHPDVLISTLKNEESAVTILAIHQNDGKFTSRPALETEIHGNDILYLYGTEKEIARFINQNF